MEKQGFVLQMTSKAGDTDCFADIYEALKTQCLADALWFGWCETEISLPRRLTNTNETEALATRWDVARIFTNCAELRAQRRGETRLTAVADRKRLARQSASGELRRDLQPIPC